MVRAQSIDLENDGTPEWLLEVVGTYGDGYYSMLWVLRQSAADLQIDRIALSHSSGEVPGPATDAAWWVDSDLKLWIVAGLEPKPPLRRSPINTGWFLISVKGSNEGTGRLFRQPRLRLRHGEPPENACGHEPAWFVPDSVPWDRSRGSCPAVFERLTEAQNWASKHSFPAHSVVAVHTAK